MRFNCRYCLKFLNHYQSQTIAEKLLNIALKINQSINQLKLIN